MTARQSFVVTITVILTALAAFLVWRLSEIVLLLFGAIIFASAVQPYVTSLDKRGLPRGAAIILIDLLLVTFVISLIVVAIPPLITFIVTVVQSGVLSTKLTQLATRLAIFGWDKFQVLIPVISLPAQLNAMIAQTEDQVQQQAWTMTQSTAVGVGQAVLLFTMAFYWLTSREQTLSLLLLLSPKSKRQRVHAIWNDIEFRLGAYVRGTGILMVIIGVASYLGLLALGVPYAPALALIAGITEAIPIVGPLIGAVPAVIVGFTVSPITGVLVALLYGVIQVLENNVLVPRIMSSNVGLNPLVIIIAIVAGSTLNGVVGAILAIPLAGALQVLAQHIWVAPSLATVPVEEVGAGGSTSPEETSTELPTPEVLLADSIDESAQHGPAEIGEAQEDEPKARKSDVVPVVPPPIPSEGKA
jgi:predicted PurR-regulated permease PerM